MIFDTIKNLGLYYSMDSRFKTAAEFVEKNDLKSMPCGSYDIGDGVKLNLAEYEAGSGGDFEAHRDYHDLQFIVSGGEIIEMIPLEYALNSTGYKPDIEFFTDSSCPATRISLTEGTFGFFAPEDAHRPCIRLTDGKTKKAVFKIKVKAAD